MLENAGETLDLNDLAPNPVAEADNFMATPALHGIEKMEHPRDPEILEKHYRIDALPRLVRPEDTEEPLDFGAYGIADPDSQEEPQLISELGGNPEEKFLELLHSDAALWDELTVAARRPHSQPVHSIAERIGDGMTLNLSMGHLSPLQTIARLSSLRAIAAARLGDRQMARDSLAIALKCRDGVAAEPTLIGGLVSISMTAILEARLPDILRADCLTGDDLHWLHGEIASHDAMALGLKMFRSEMAFSATVYTDILKLPRRERMSALAPISNDGISIETVVGSLIPDSFYLRNQATTTEWNYRYNVKPLKEFDLEAMRTAPDDIQHRIANASWFSYETFLAKQAIVSTGGITSRIIASHSNHQLMTTGIALERFRIANGNFPAELEALVPNYLEAVPIDIAAGDSTSPQALTYEPAADGSSYTLRATPLRPDEKNRGDGLQFER